MPCSSRQIAHRSTLFLLVGSIGQVKLWRSSGQIDSSGAGIVGWEGTLKDVCNDNVMGSNSDVMYASVNSE